MENAASDTTNEMIRCPIYLVLEQMVSPVFS